MRALVGRCGTALSCLALVGCMQAVAEPALTTSDAPNYMAQDTSVEDQYIYLSTLQYLSENASPEFLDAMGTIGGTALTSDDAAAGTLSGVDTRLSDPLLLQADPASIVAMAQSLFTLETRSEAELSAHLDTLETETPALAEDALQLAILENGVRFRFALAQALYAADLKALPRGQQDAIEQYIEGTYDLRDDMELLAFDIDVDGLAQEALEQYRSAYAALERGVRMDLDPYSFEEDGERAARMTEAAGEGIAGGMRAMYLQLIFFFAIAMQ